MTLNEYAELMENSDGSGTLDCVRNLGLCGRALLWFGFLHPRRIRVCASPCFSRGDRVQIFTPLGIAARGEALVERVKPPYRIGWIPRSGWIELDRNLPPGTRKGDFVVVTPNAR